MPPVRLHWRELVHAHCPGASRGSARVAGLATRILFAAALLLGTARTSDAQTSAARNESPFACAECLAAFVPAPDTGSPRRALADSSAVAAPTARPPGRSKLPYLFFGAMTAGVVANTVIGADQDPGGYRDTWGSEASFPDKMVHGLAAFALTSVGVDLKVRPIFAALTTCAAGAIFETTQGYISSYDIAADCTGAAVAGLWRHWRASR